MKYLAVAWVCITLWSCNQTVEKENASVQETSVDVAMEADVEIENTTGIAMMNFEELQAAYLNNSDETVYVVNFWATWCKPCIKELPYFETITEQYDPSQVKVILVSLDFPEKLVTNVGPYVEKNNIQSEVVLLNDDNANKWIPLVSDEWSGAIPATVIYDKDERKFYERSFTFEELETEIKSFL